RHARSRDLRRYRRGPCGRRARETRVAARPVQFMLAVAARDWQFTLVSDDADLSPASLRRLERRDARPGRCAGALACVIVGGPPVVLALGSSNALNRKSPCP